MTTTMPKTVIQNIEESKFTTEKDAKTKFRIKKNITVMTTVTIDDTLRT